MSEKTTFMYSVPHGKEKNTTAVNDNSRISEVSELHFVMGDKPSELARK